MTCKQIRPMLYLNRGGELTQAEARAMADHLIGCDSCSREKALIEQATGYLRGLDSVPLVSPDPEALTRRILEHVSLEMPSRPKQNRTSLIDRILDSFSAPAVRWASAGCIVSTVVLILFQYFSILNDVYNLEAQQMHYGRTSGIPHVAYVVDARPLQGTPEGVLLSRLDGLTPRGFLVLSERSTATWRVHEQSSSLGFARQPLTGSDRETMQTLLTYLTTNAYPLLSFTREGV